MSGVQRRCQWPGDGKRTTRRRPSVYAIFLVVAVLGALTGVIGPVAPAAAALPAPAPIISTVAGSIHGYGGDGGRATVAKLASPNGVAVDAAGNVFVADTNNYRIRKVDTTGTITTVAGNGNQTAPGEPVAEGVPATSATFWYLTDVATDVVGNLFIADPGTQRIRKVDPSGTITTVAGNGTGGYSGDGGPATAAAIHNAVGVAADAEGNLLIADAGNQRIRKVDPSGIITTVAGNGTSGYSGDGGPATLAQLYSPGDVTAHAGRLFISDTSNRRVRRVDASGTISTYAGSGPPFPAPSGYGGDGGPATAAQLNPVSVATDAAGNLFIADEYNHRIRKVDPSGTITTHAGSGPVAAGGGPLDSFNEGGSSGDGGPATAAKITRPRGVAADPAGNVFLTDAGKSTVRAVGVLSVVVSDDIDPAPVGGRMTYTATVGNFSAVAATGVTLADTLPAGATFVSARPWQGSCSPGAGRVSCDLGTLGPGRATRVNITVTAPPSPTTMANRATLGATHPDRFRFDDADTETTQAVNPSLGLYIDDAPDPGQVGKPHVYTLTVANVLPGPATGVVLSDTLPPEVSFRWAQSPHATCRYSGGTVTCAVKDLAYGERASVQIAVNALKPGLSTNTATVRANQFPTGTTTSAQTRINHAQCGRVVTQNTVLDADIGPCVGNGIVVGDDGITVDLGGKRVFGFPGRGDGSAAGIRLPGRSGVTVKNGTVMDFDAGVFVREGSANTLTALTLRDNLGPDGGAAELGDGIYVLSSPLNRIVGNKIVNNGIYDGIGIYGGGSNHNVIENNLIEGTRGPANPAGSFGQGIIVNGFTEALPQLAGTVAVGTRIANNTIRRNASAGIANNNHTDATIEANTVDANGLRNSNGNGIGVQLGPGAPPGTRILIQNNEVHGNGEDGIRIARFTTSNRILNNDAADNNALDNGSVDLHDLEGGCLGNVWSGNSWGSGGYSPPCAANGGTGPQPQPSSAAVPPDPTVDMALPVRRAPR